MSQIPDLAAPALSLRTGTEQGRSARVSQSCGPGRTKYSLTCSEAARCVRRRNGPLSVSRRYTGRRRTSVAPLVPCPLTPTSPPASPLNRASHADDEPTRKEPEHGAAHQAGLAMSASLMPSTKLRVVANGWLRAKTHGVELLRAQTRFCSPKLQCSICFALTDDLVNDARDRCPGVDYNTVFRNVFFHLMQSRNERAFRLFSAPLIFRSLVKPLVQYPGWRPRNPIQQPARAAQ